MTSPKDFHINNDVIDRVAALPAVRQACDTATKLIELWPLTDATQMDNDVQYAENLQVRITRTMAAMITGQDVTMPDAEYVYEGADEIPGRPQEIVDALLASNDAYDAISDYSDTGDSQAVFDAMNTLGFDVDDQTTAQIKSTVESVEALVAPEATDDGRVQPTTDVDVLARRFAMVMAACDALFALFGADGNDMSRGVLVLLYANELGERLSIPRVCMEVDDFRSLLDARASAAGSVGDSVEALATTLAPLAAKEWDHHREDVLWDPEEAKKRAKEEDERKSKEALSAKFAHVKDDPNKEKVEL